MALVCPGCGEYILPRADAQGQTACCLECGHVWPTRIVPLFIVTGASGCGKTAVVAPLRRLLPAWDIFETDVLHAADWDQQRSNWLRVAHSVAQSGRPCILCGTLLPGDVDRCDHRPLFSTVHYINLHCSDEVRAARLRARPAWRGSDREAFIQQHAEFARWLIDHAADAAAGFDPPMPVLDTSDISEQDVAARIAEWATGIWRRSFIGGRRMDARDPPGRPDPMPQGPARADRAD